MFPKSPCTAFWWMVHNNRGNFFFSAEELFWAVAGEVEGRNRRKGR